MSEIMQNYLAATKDERTAADELNQLTTAIANISAVLSEDPMRLILPNPNADIDRRELALHETRRLKIEPDKWPTYSQIVASVTKFRQAKDKTDQAWLAFPRDHRELIVGPDRED
ncbi:MAG: hypothetical protein CTY31_12390 [Hyphomicrobium sp.]|nr:MAG: hypothetical protein CTY39_09975 [Hyphomicrobium sp.]PPC98810.1 MAG: hypothetical protein CTY31_12390 [Hyphomicrobium sp.]